VFPMRLTTVERPVVRHEMGHARIVRGADFGDELGSTPESAGLRTISSGFPPVARDDHETVERATFLYDALYAVLKARERGEQR
jgi:hypothetical protein